ncbi:FecR family protein [Methyloversatilis thermotolerans]|uniref:FecR family protein n=1 Tax=Methyloversatilis thermotolerans TaxID=1346290 RepID=UPI00036E3FEA|nr:FecR domain-containing protein [Methyloversatilis thermotolerans]
MTPPISKDWWIAAALTGATLPAAHAQTAPAPRAGIVSAITASAPATANKKTVVVGDSVQPGETLRSGPNGQLHVLFLDQSSVTMGPDTELVIDTFNYDPATRQGAIKLRLNQGLVRVVGGHISKNTATAIITDVGRVEIRGGISLIQYVPTFPKPEAKALNVGPAIGSQAPGLSTVFMFGQQQRVVGVAVSDGGNSSNEQRVVRVDDDGNSSNVAVITRPGFGSTISGSGAAPSEPTRVPINQLNGMLNSLETSPTGGNQGSNPNPPPAPPENLISTGNSGGTGGGSPGVGLTPDRVQTSVDRNVNANPTQTLQNLLGTGLTVIAS